MSDEIVHEAARADAGVAKGGFGHPFATKSGRPSPQKIPQIEGKNGILNSIRPIY